MSATESLPSISEAVTFITKEVMPVSVCYPLLTKTGLLMMMMMMMMEEVLKIHALRESETLNRREGNIGSKNVHVNGKEIDERFVTHCTIRVQLNGTGVKIYR